MIILFCLLICFNEVVTLAPTKGVIIGGGRIGSLLYELNGKQDIFLTSRSDAIPEVDGPMYVCTRNDDLEDIILKCPESKLENLIFLQNGILTPYLKSKGLEDNTQVLVYFAVSKLGEKPIDGKTDLNPNGLTAATGKWAEDFKCRLDSGLSCHVMEKEPWTVAMHEKHIWICAFMAIGAKYNCNVGDVEKYHTTEVKCLINELATAAMMETGVSFTQDIPERLCDYARSVAHFPTTLKEFQWRNGWFADITFKAIATERADPCPSHTEILQEQGLLYGARKSWIQRNKAKAARAKERQIYERYEREVVMANAQSSEGNVSSPTMKKYRG